MKGCVNQILSPIKCHEKCFIISTEQDLKNNLAIGDNMNDNVLHL